MLDIVHRIPFKLIKKSLVSRIHMTTPTDIRSAPLFEGPSGPGCLLRANMRGRPRERYPAAPHLAAEKILVGNEELRPGWAMEWARTPAFFYGATDCSWTLPRHISSSACTANGPVVAELYPDLIYESKRLAMPVEMSSELNVLSGAWIVFPSRIAAPPRLYLEKPPRCPT